jgi:hypothetical protein
MNTPPPSPEPTIPQLQQEVAQLRQQYRAVSQYLWTVIRSLRAEEHEVTLDTSGVDPLWALVFLQVNDAQGVIDPNRIQILAGTQPEMTDQEKKRLVRRLAGTKDKLVDAMAELKMDFPPPYAERRISDRVVWKKDPGVWEKTTIDNN